MKSRKSFEAALDKLESFARQSTSSDRDAAEFGREHGKRVRVELLDFYDETQYAITTLAVAAAAKLT